MTDDAHRMERATTTERIPSPPPYYIERHRLDERFQQARGRLLRVLAPSGYGKTSLVARWAAAETRPVRWVDVSRSDDDPIALFDTLRTALAGILTPPPAPGGEFAVDSYAEALEAGVASGPLVTPFVLVLDDVHRIESAAGSELIRALAERLPPDSTLILVGHGHHDHGTIGRLRLIPGVVEISVDELALDSSEARELLDLIGVDPDQANVEPLLEQLEGWPAGIRLVGEALRAGTAPSPIGDNDELVDHLSRQWIAQLDQHERDFLREAACLESFTPEQCDRVLDRRDSAGLIRELHRGRTVVFPLDRRNERYRMHGLLRRSLSAELQRGNPDRWTEIHIAAARDAEQSGDIDVAVEHAINAGDSALVETLLVEHGGRYFPTGRGATIKRWLEAIPPDVARGSPGPVGLACLEALHRGDDVGATDWLGQLDQVIARRGPGNDPTRTWAPVIHAALDERAAGELLPIIAEARLALVGGPWAAFATWIHGSLSFMVGDVTSARDALRAGEFEARLSDLPLLIGHCAATSSIIDACEGDDDAAEAAAQRALEAVEACGGELLPTSALPMAAVTLQDARHGDRQATARHLGIARRSLGSYRTVAPWFNVIARLPLIRASMLVDDRTTGRALMQELDHHARHETRHSGPPAHSALACARRLREQLDAMHVPATGSSALTDAELRVLHLLPTNLSLAEIGTQLLVSRNTVKSHATSIYRKLGAARRADAVELARRAGLLPESTPP